MSPRAAARLATLAFTRVYDYVAGKADWGSFNLRVEGRAGSETRAGAHVRPDVPTCLLDAPRRDGRADARAEPDQRARDDLRRAARWTSRARGRRARLIRAETLKVTAHALS